MKRLTPRSQGHRYFHVEIQLQVALGEQRVQRLVAQAVILLARGLARGLLLRRARLLPRLVLRVLPDT